MPSSSPVHNRHSPAAAPGPVVQCYLGQLNQKTDKGFEFFDGTIVKTGTSVIKGKSTDGTQDGYVRYSFDKDLCILEHIETHPENGTGLGPLLMNLLARKAKEKGYKKMAVAGPRYPTYYTRFGFKIEDPRYGTGATQTILEKTEEFIRRDWLNPQFADVYLRDWKRHQAKLTPVLSEFPRIE